jgi:hypothetical protein
VGPRDEQRLSMSRHARARRPHGAVNTRTPGGRHPEPWRRHPLGKIFLNDSERSLLAPNVLEGARRGYRQAGLDLVAGFDAPPRHAPPVR